MKIKNDVAKRISKTLDSIKIPVNVKPSLLTKLGLSFVRLGSWLIKKGGIEVSAK